jgi:hypothetical protein
LPLLRGLRSISPNVLLSMQSSGLDHAGTADFSREEVVGAAIPNPTHGTTLVRAAPVATTAEP